MTGGSESLWKKNLDDPSYLSDDGRWKASLRSPHLKHKTAEVSLFFDGWYNSPWIDQAIKRERVKGSTCVRNREQFHHISAKGVFDIVHLLKSCAKQKDLVKGSKVHAYIQSNKFLEENCYVASSLISMYIRCGALAKAQEVLDELSVHSVVSWNALIAGYAQQGYGGEALKCFVSMQHEGHSPDAVTFTCALKACGSIGEVAKVEQIHGKIVSLGMLGKDIVLGSTLVDAYARCGAMAKAQQVFSELPIKDVVAWTALISGYAQQVQGEQALRCFENMQHEGHCPDVVTFVCALKACGSLKALTKGIQIHDKIVSLGLLEKNIVLGNALVDMYARCGAFVAAGQVLEGIHVRNVVLWNALIAGYIQQGNDEEALKLFDSMQYEGHSPNVVTFTCVLKACGVIGAAAKGEQIHERILSLNLLRTDIVLGSSLVDMYVRCGALTTAQQVFDGLSVQNVVAWTALIAGYAQEGQSMEALECFEMMRSKGVRPDSVTMTCVLNACSHSGLLDKFELCFGRMSTSYGLTPDMEHYCCMLDLFGRAGMLDKALVAIMNMSCDDCLPFWLTVLGTCQKWGAVKIGQLAFEHACQIDKSNASAYVSMTNIYTITDMQEDFNCSRKDETKDT